MKLHLAGAATARLLHILLSLSSLFALQLAGQHFSSNLNAAPARKLHSLNPPLALNRFTLSL